MKWIKCHIKYWQVWVWFLFIYLFIWRESKGTFKSDGERGTRSSKCEWLFICLQTRAFGTKVARRVWVWLVLSENWSLNRKEIIQNFVSFNRMQTAYYCLIKFVASWAHQISGLSPPCSYLKVSSKHTNCIFRTVYLAIKQRKDRVAGITSFFALKKN